MPNIGTLQDKFSKTWIYLNPDQLTGPSAWNVASTPFVANDEKVFAIPPIMVNQENSLVKLWYSIIDCRSFDEASRLQLASNTPNFERDTLSNVTSIEGESPVFTNKFETETVIFFDISELTSVNAALFTDTPALYNGNTIETLETTEPLGAVENDGVATVFFDMTTLEDA